VRCIEGEVPDPKGEAFYLDKVWGWVHKAENGWHTITGTPITDESPGPDEVNDPLSILE